MKKPRTVDEYIAQAPKEVRGKLEMLRAIIRSAAPKAAVRLPLDEKLPSALIKELVMAKVKWNETGK